MDERAPSQVAGWCLSLVIPAYNEEAAIRRAIREADDALAEIACDYEILVVDDGSTDDTAAAVARCAATRPHVRLLRHAHNRGYGAALRTGFAAARFDRVAFTDADCQFDLADLGRLVPLCDQQPLAVGFRAERQDRSSRRFISWAYNVLTRALLGTGVRDCDCALKVFRRDTLARLMPRSDGFFVNTEMLARAGQLGYRPAEIAVQHRPRRQGMSKVSLADVPRTLAVLLPFWWSQVLFPAHTPATANGIRARPHARALALLLVLGGLLFFSRLRCPLLEPDEARYAEIPRQMLTQASWLVPVLHGQPYYHKPPLLYWLVMASYCTFGVTDWAARLVPCAAALSTVGVAYLWGARTLGPRAAFGGALILCLSVRFVYLGRMLSMDSLLCLWATVAFACAHAAIVRQRLRFGWWILSALACGLGILTKGPVALALLAPPVAASTWLDRRSARPRLRAWMLYVAVAAAVAGPWYVAVAARDLSFLREFLWTHNIVRYVRPIDHREPLWYYVPGLALGMLPWTLLLPGFAVFLARRSASAAGSRPAELGLLLASALWCLVFFSAAGCKRPAYILPAMPPLALALGVYLDMLVPRDLLQRVSDSLARRVVLAHRATLLVLGAGVVLGLVAVVAGIQKPTRALALIVPAAAALCVFRRPRHARPGLAWCGCAGATFLVLLSAEQLTLPGYVRKFSIRSQARALARRFADADLPVACYPHRWDSVSFYLGRADIRAYAVGQRPAMVADLGRQATTLVFIKSDGCLAEFLNALPARLEFVGYGRPGLITAGIVRQRCAGPTGLLARQTFGQAGKISDGWLSSR